MATFSLTASNYPSMAVLLLLFGMMIMISLEITGAQSIGVCYGMVGDNLPSHHEVVQLYKSRNIGRMRLYDPNQGAMEALRGSNIQVLLTVPNPNIRELASNPWAAADWVQRNVLNYWPQVNVRYIAVGNEIIPSENAWNILPAMQNIYTAIVQAGLHDQIKVSTSVDTGILGNSYPPSQGSFSGNSRQFLEPIVQFLARTGSPLLANVYPYFSYVGNPGAISLEYALFTSPSVVVTDDQLGYQNLFDAMVDAVYAALEKVGGSGVDIVISESGWPSAGGVAATTWNAQTYNSNLIRHVGNGTPRRPGKPLQTYLFAMFNENQKQPPGVEQNFGLFYPNKQPVYPVSFTSNKVEDLQKISVDAISSSILGTDEEIKKLANKEEVLVFSS